MRLPLIASLILLLSFCHPPLSSARAAEFDCQNSKTRIEKIICRDSALSKADSEMNAHYQNIRSKVSPNGREAMKREQISELGRLKFCDNPNSQKNSDQNITECIRSWYNSREQYLSSIMERPPLLVFYDVVSQTLAPPQPQTMMAPILAIDGQSLKIRTAVRSSLPTRRSESYAPPPKNITTLARRCL